ncbi:homoserine O-succinyltransferase [Escherichia coli]
MLTLRAALIRDYTDLEILARDEKGDAHCLCRRGLATAFVTGHAQYDAQTLAQEFLPQYGKPD